MGRRPAQLWQLFVDESGSFEPGDPSVVAGVLLGATDPKDERVALRSALESAFPFVPYPPHASWLQQEASIALPWCEPGRAKSSPLSVRAAVDAILASDDPVPAAVRAALEARAQPAFAQVRDCTQWLRAAAPRAARALVALREDGFRGVRELVSTVVGSTESCTLASCTDSTDEGGSGPTSWLPRASGLDRYLLTLSGLFERVYATLRARDGVRHDVLVHVATRFVEVDGVRRMPMTAAVVGRAARVAATFPWCAPRADALDERVRLVPMMPAAFDENVHPGLVLADFVSNRLRHALGSRSTWDEVKSALAARIGPLPAEWVPRGFAAAGALPTVSAEGQPRRAVRAAFAGRAEPVEDVGCWAREQAERWIAASRVPGVAGGAR